MSLTLQRCLMKNLKKSKAQIKFEKRIQDLMCNGDLYRLINPYETNYCSWEVVSKDKKHIFVMACKVLAVAQTKVKKLNYRDLIRISNTEIHLQVKFTAVIF